MSSRYIALKNTKLAALSACTECGAILYRTTQTLHDAAHLEALEALHDPAPPSLRALQRLARGQRPKTQRDHPGRFKPRSPSDAARSSSA